MLRHIFRRASFTNPFARSSARSKAKKQVQAIRRAAAATAEPLECRQLLNAGDLDPSFGSVGMVVLPSQGIIQASAMQTDGKAVLAGWTSSSPTSFWVERVTPAGTLDKTFGTNGVVTTSFPDSATATTVAIDSDGKIIVAGGADLARYNPDGSLDTSFGTGGKLTVPASSNISAEAIALTNDNRIVVAGRTAIQDPAHPDDPNAKLATFTVAMFTPAGALDPAFNSTGTVTERLDNTYNTALRGQNAAVAVQPDGKVLFGANSQNNPAVWRFNADGSPDTAFGQNGMANIPMLAVDLSDDRYDSAATSQLIVQPDGRILASAQFNHYDSIANDFAVARFNSDGSVDTTFGDTEGAPGGGLIKLPNPPHSMGISTSLLLQPDGKILMGGSDGNLTDEIFRLTSSGSIDSTFAFTPFTFGSRNVGSFYTSLNLTPDGKILLVDNPSTIDGTKLGLAGALGDSAPTAGQLTATITNTLPTSVIGGKPGSVSLLIKNTGSTTFSGPISLQVFESTDSTPGIDDTNLTTLSLPDTTLKPNKTKTLRVPFTYASMLPTGSYTIIATVTQTDAGTAAYPVASQRPVAIVQPSGDLALSVIPPDAVHLKAGQKARMVLEIKNLGNVKVTGSPVVALAESDGGINRTGLTQTTLKPLTLPVNGKRRVTLTYTPTADFGPTFYLVAQLGGNLIPTDPNTNGNDVVNINATLT